VLAVVQRLLPVEHMAPQFQQWALLQQRWLVEALRLESALHLAAKVAVNLAIQLAVKLPVLPSV
jgi:hypothetical protein